MTASQDDALGDFDRAYRPGLMRFFLRRVRNHSEAEDLTQEVFIRVASRDRSAVQKPESYIFQVAANLLRDRARRVQVRAEFAAGLCVLDENVDLLDPHRIAVGREALQRLNQGLDELPERTRQIFLLFRYEHVDQRTIAETFGISSSAVEKHLYRAMAQLSAKLGEME